MALEGDLKGDSSTVNANNNHNPNPNHYRTRALTVLK